jgi:hypothetical protein
VSLVPYALAVIAMTWKWPAGADGQIPRMSDDFNPPPITTDMGLF